MCEYCESQHTCKGNFFGKDIKMPLAFNQKGQKNCNIIKYLGEKKYQITIFDGCVPDCYVEINYCPMCGRDLRGKSENE